jgi:hypothetical protein
VVAIAGEKERRWMDWGYYDAEESKSMEIGWSRGLEELELEIARWQLDRYL